jgi:hypothetical protein
MTDHDELFANALEKTQRRVLSFEGKIYRAFDDLDTGLRARPLSEWHAEAARPQFGELTGKAFGMALSLSMVAVEADRRYRAQAAIEWADDKWARDFEWEGRVRHDYELARKRGMVPLEDPPQAWRRTPLACLMGREPLTPEDEGRWHLSVSHIERIPTWDELVETAHVLRPGVPFVVGLPPRSWWMNYDQRVLHLWETRDDLLVEHWRRGARGDTPT